MTAPASGGTLAPPELRGPRVLVRVACPEDTAAIWDAAQDPPRNAPDGTPKAPASRSDIAQTVADDIAAWRFWPGAFLPLTLWELASERYLGGIALTNIDWGVPRFEIGYRLRPAAEGQGFMTEAVQRVTAYAFDDLSAQRVSIHCGARNERSIKIPQRLGFPEEGLLRSYSRNEDGALENLRVFALTRDDFQTLRRRWSAG